MRDKIIGNGRTCPNLLCNPAAALPWGNIAAMPSGAYVDDSRAHYPSQRTHTAIVLISLNSAFRTVHVLTGWGPYEEYPKNLELELASRVAEFIHIGAIIALYSSTFSVRLYNILKD